MGPEELRGRIAARLKSARAAAGLSLDAAAARTGVSKAMLGQIERRESTPTIALLWRIAGGLGLSFSSFLTGEAAGPDGPAPDRPPFPDDPDMQVRVLLPYAPDTRLEIFEVTLTRGHRQRSSPHQPGVIEHVVVTAGELEVVHGATSHRLAPGQALRFPADQPHEYAAIGGKAVFQNIISYT